MKFDKTLMNIVISFRPLSGFLFSNKVYLLHLKTLKICFRPLSGFLFSNYVYTIEGNTSLGVRFRPLSGFLFSNTMSEHLIRSMNKKVSVPYRGFYFLIDTNWI